MTEEVGLRMILLFPIVVGTAGLILHYLTRKPGMSEDKHPLFELTPYDLDCLAVYFKTHRQEYDVWAAQEFGEVHGKEEGYERTAAEDLADIFSRAYMEDLGK